ncbi:exocyst complex protein [Gautieria morchelliformis]|nr:exocyst complex protein [Gautieria morchelliformis]
MSSDMFALDPSVEEVLNISTFEDKFDVKDFVSSISERLISHSKAEPGPFEPRPFIRTFESAVDRLIEIRKNLQRETDTLEKSVKQAERDYSKNITELNGGFEAVGKSFGSMESKMSEVGRTAIRIGEQLESVHISRQRAQAAYDLIDYYNHFSKGDTTRLDNLQKDGGKEGRHQAAIILRRLSTVAREVDLPSAEKTRENIDKYCEKFEKNMLRLFDRCYRKGDPKMMNACSHEYVAKNFLTFRQHCAQTLLDFNGGASCVQIYVNQHDFFISRNRVQELSEVESGQLWEILPDPDSSPPKSEPGLSALFAEIRTTVAQEAQIVQAVFPNPPMVMQVFLQRVFAQSIQQYLELLLNKASSISQLSFLRMLHLAHSQTSSLVEALKGFDLSHLTSRSGSDRAVTDALMASSATPGGTGQIVPVSVMLETAMDELFMPFTEGQKYLERESKNLGELYSSYLYRFTRYHESVSKSKTSNLLNRVVNQINAAASNTSSTSVSTTTTAQAAAALIKFSGFGNAAEREKEKLGEETVREEDGKISIDVSEKMLKWHAEAVGRCVEVSSTSDVPKNAFALLRVLAEALGRSYVEAALETSLTRLENRDPKLEPDLSPFATLRMADMICHLWQQYVNIALMPLSSSSVTIRRDMVIFNTQTINRIEGTANALVQRVTDTVVAWLATQLSKQKRSDFKPRNDDLSFARVNTEPCEACCETLEKARDVAKQSLTGRNLEVFLTEVGVTFHTLLLDHLKKFPVSATGGLMLAKDLKSYQDIIATFNMPSLSERFEFIRQLGNVFLIQPDILRSYITENYLGRIEPTLLRPYLAQRADWGKEEKALEGLFGEEGEHEGKGFKDRLGVSRMMRELEGLRIGDGGGSAFSGGFSFNSLNARSLGI